ncbi:hypothetical protein, partial [Acinetobacter baumannii]|uniref:hypothetical protein n=1 Tax=Acinetobacter baumannii TaxID=470 RepID=UPI001C076513
QQTSIILPSHWPKQIKNGDYIPVEDKKLREELTDNFLASLGNANIRVLSVDEVCNAIFYKKYLK